MTDAPQDPKPQREVREESSETVTHLREERLPREAKMARERAQLEGAHEVRYVERGFRPRHHQDIEQVRAAVDALVAQRRALPEPAPLPAPAAPAPPPVDEARRAALEPHLPGRLVAVESRYRVSEGEVVEATWERDGARRSGIYLLAGGAARPFDELESRIDALPEPTRPAPVAEASSVLPAPVETSVPAPAAPAQAEAPKKKGFGLKLGKGKASRGEDAPASQEAPPAPKAEEPSSGAAPKKRFGFGRK